MSKRKQPVSERRRPQVEINLLEEEERSTGLVRVRRGCSLPFVGAWLVLLLAFLDQLRTLA